MTEQEYIGLVPKAAPQDLFQQMEEQSEWFRRGILGFKAISYEEGQYTQYRYDFGGDFRRDDEKRPALLRCSKCERCCLGEWIHADAGCRNAASAQKGVYIYDDYYQTDGEHKNLDIMLCPMCGEEVLLMSARDLSHGHTRQATMTVATVEKGYPVFTKYLMEKWNSFDQEKSWADAMECYIIDGKKVVRLAQGKKMYYQWYWDHWAMRKKAVDNLGLPYMHRQLPDYEGTVLENAKMAEYFEATYEKSMFAPLPYIRFYLKKPTIENLVTAGIGSVLGYAIKQECMSYGVSMSKVCPNLKWINWKEKKPAKMLGMNREQWRTARELDLGLEWYKLWASGKVKDFELLLMANEHKETGYMLKTLMEDTLTRGREKKILRYLKKEKETIQYYLDYIRVANALGEEVSDPVVMYPPDLRRAHDRVVAARKIGNVEKYAKAFAKMSERCRGLEWEKDGICIRVANSPQELVQEGSVLHHCVGGYSENHCRGNIILFIRHTRRPERSWFTLNVNTTEKKVIQNHGYRNERLPNGEVLHIPKQVKEFVEEWKKQVLEPWHLPKETA